MKVNKVIHKKKSFSDIYFNLYLYSLLGYAVMGKGFAYIGFKNIYIGELLLLSGLALILLTNINIVTLFIKKNYLLVLFIVWNSICTFPYIFTYGFDTLRDGVLWGYSLFAFIIFTLLITKPQRLNIMLEKYKWFVPFYLITNFIIYNSGSLLQKFPHWPGSPVPLIFIKGGDRMVLLGGIALFIFLQVKKVNIIWLVITFIELIPGLYSSRSGLLAVFTSFFIIIYIRLRTKKVQQLIAVLTLIIILVFICFSSHPVVKESICEISSIFVNSDTPEYRSRENTKKWRLDWWEKIVNYTFFGEYFFTGKGYGINIAIDDGFWSENNNRFNLLRSPHNVNMTILARSGVPGFILWILLHFSWAYLLIKKYYQSKKNNQEKWSILFLFIITYWTTFIVNGSFDVYLEGPQAGIPFWTVFGIGISSVYLYNTQPDILEN